MEEWQEPIRQHYEAKSLPALRAEAILAAGRSAAAARRRRHQWLAIAAMVMICLSGAAVLRFRQATLNVSPGALTERDVAAAVQAFFAHGPPKLGQVSTDRTALERWLREQGAPVPNELPAFFQSLPSFACQVLDVRGQRVSLLCFVLSTPVQPTGSAAGTPMPAKPPELVHVLVAPRSAFRTAPQPGTRVALTADGTWTFVAWSTDSQVLIAATDVPGALLTQRLGAL